MHQWRSEDEIRKQGIYQVDQCSEGVHRIPYTDIWQQCCLWLDALKDRDCWRQKSEVSLTSNTYCHQHPSPLSMYPSKDIHFHDCYQHGEINLQKVFQHQKNILLDMACLSNNFMLTMNLFMKTIWYHSQRFSSLSYLVI